MGSMVVLALIIVLVSGLIAYVGDLVGRKMGRKRLTLMGLRPRHTAIVISVGVGMLIAVLTLATTLAVNKSIRDQFFTPLERVKSDLVTSHRQLVTEQGLLSNTQDELDTKAKELSVSQENSEQIQQDLAKAQQRMLHVRQFLQATTTELQQRVHELAQAKQDILHATEAYARVRDQLLQSKADLSVAQRNLQDTQKKLDVSQNDLQDSQQKLLDAQNHLRTTRDQLTEAQGNLQETHDKLTLSESTLVNLQEKINGLNSEKLRLEENLNTLELTLNNSSHALTESVFSPLSYAYGQEILSGLLPAHANEKQRLAFVSAFLAAAENVVRQRNVDLPKDTDAIIYLAAENETTTIYSEQEAIDVLAKRIGTLKNDNGVIIHLTTMSNVPVKGPAFVAVDHIELLPNAVIYRPNSIVAAVPFEIGPQTTTADILGKLADDLLRDEVPAALRAKGMVSIARRFDPDHPDTIPEATMPKVSWSQLIDGAKKAQSYMGKVRLLARARSEVTSYGPLNIEIDVEPVK